MLLTVVMMFGMVIPVSAAEVTESPAPTTEVVVVEADPAEEEAEPAETPEETAPAETPVVKEAQPEAEETPAPNEDSDLPEETESPEQTEAPSEYVIFTGGGDETAEETAAAEDSAVVEAEDSYSQEKVGAFIGAYLVEPGVEYPIDEESYAEAGEETPSVYLAVTEENAEQIAGARDDWKALTAAEQEAVDAVLCAAQVDALIREAIAKAEEEGTELSEEDIQVLEEETLASLTAEREEEAEAPEAITFAALLSTAMDMLGISEDEEEPEEEVEETKEALTAKEFVAKYLTSETGSVVIQVSFDSISGILAAEEDWNAMSASSQNKVNSILSEAATPDIAGPDEVEQLSYDELLETAYLALENTGWTVDEDGTVTVAEDFEYEPVVVTEGEITSVSEYTVDIDGKDITLSIGFSDYGISLLGFDEDVATNLENITLEGTGQTAEMWISKGNWLNPPGEPYMDYYLATGSYIGMIWTGGWIGAHYLNYDGVNSYGGYCLEPVHHHASEYLDEGPETVWNTYLTEYQRKAICVALLYGYHGPYDESAADEHHGYNMATQMIIWEIVMGYRYTKDSYKIYSWGLYNLFSGLSYFKTWVKPYYRYIHQHMIMHGLRPDWTENELADAIENPIDLTENTSAGTYDVTLYHTSGGDLTSSSYGDDYDWLSQYTYKAYADKALTQEISGITFTTTQSKSRLVISVPEAIYNAYEMIYIEVETPSKTVSDMFLRVWTPNPNDYAQTFIEGGGGEPAYAYMALRAGGEGDPFSLTVNKTAKQFSAPAVSAVDGAYYVGTYASAKALSGVTFALYEAVDANSDGVADSSGGVYTLGGLVDRKTVDDNGQATWTDLSRSSKYILVETSAPLPYTVSGFTNGQYLVEAPGDDDTDSVTVEWENEAQWFEFSIAKTDATTGSYLAGATFGLFAATDISWQDSYYDRTNTISANEMVATFTTGTNVTDSGMVVTTSGGVTTVKVTLPAGSYYIKEIAAPDGYTVSESMYTVINFNAGSTSTSIVSGSNVGTLTSQSSTLTITNNPESTFELNVAKKAKVLADPYTRSSDGVTYVNTYSSTHVLTGVTFGLYETVDANSDGTPDTNADGSYVLGTSMGEQAVNASGKASWAGLDVNMVYVLKELEVPLQYSSSANAHGEFLIDNTAAGNSTVEYEVMNYPRYIEFSIAKKGADTGAYLAGAEFGVYAAETVVWKDYSDGGTNAIAADTLMGTFTTGTDKTDSNFPMKVTTVDGVTTVVMQVPLGKYYIKEISAPSGYELDETEYMVASYTGSETTSDVVQCTNLSYTWYGFNSETLTTQSGPQTIINKVPAKEYFDLVVNKTANAITGISGYAADGSVSGYTYDYDTSISDLSSVAALFRLYEAVDEDGDGVADLDDDGFYAITGTLVSEQWTDSEGKLYWYNLDKDKQYILHEAAAPATYNKPSFLGNRILVTPDDNTVTYEVDANNGASYIYLSLRKLDSKTNEPVQGAVFGVYMGEDMYVPGTTTVAVPKDTLLVTGTTNADGYIWGIGNRAIRPGYKYYVKEISVPDGWILDTTEYYLDVFEDYVTYDMMVCTNVDSTNGANAWDHTTTYYINGTGNAYYYYNDSTFDLTVNKRVQSVKPNETTGTYSGDGTDPYVEYALDYSNLDTAQFGPAAQIGLWACTGNATKPLTNVRFALYKATDADGDGNADIESSYNNGGGSETYYHYVLDEANLVSEQWVDANGVAQWEDLDIGTQYILVETAAPLYASGVSLSTGSLHTLIDNSTDPQPEVSVDILNANVGFFIKFTKEDSLFDRLVTGAVYGAYYGSEVTDIYGNVAIEKDTLIRTFISTGGSEESVGILYATNTLLPADIYIQEIKAPDGYALDSTKYTVITKEEWETVTTELTDYVDSTNTRVVSRIVKVTNDPLLHPVSVTKYAEQPSSVTTTTNGVSFNYTMDTLSGATYKLTAAEAIYDYDGNQVYAAGDDVPMYIFLDNYFKDGMGDMDGSGYVDTLDASLILAYIDGNYAQYVSRYGKFKTAIADIDRDGDVDEDDTDLMLAYESLYEIYAVDTVSTMEDGSTAFWVEYPGKYTLTEVDTPDGYTLGQPDGYSSYTNSRTFTIEESDSVIPKADYDTSKIPTDLTFNFYNKRAEITIRAYKTDAETGKPLAGAVMGLFAFENILANDGTVLVNKGDLVAQATTGSDGYASFNVDLPATGKYSISEITPPTGYLLTETVYGPIDIDYGADGTTPDAGVTMTYTKTDTEYVRNLTAAFTNVEASKGTLLIYKNGESLAGATTAADGTITFDYRFGYLEDAVFDIYAAEDITTSDTPPTTLHKAGDLVRSGVTTNSSGVAVVEGLYLGKYTVVERSAPYGYVVVLDSNYRGAFYSAEGDWDDEDLTDADGNPITDSFEADETASRLETEQVVELTGQNTLGLYTVDFWNPRQTAKVTVTKVEDGTNTPLAGAVFGLYANEDIYDADDNVIVTAGTLLCKATSGAGGIAEFDIDLPVDYEYSIKEISAPDGYTASSTVKTFTFDYSDQDEGVQEFDYTYTNSIKTGRLIIHKMGEALVGATAADLSDPNSGYTLTYGNSPLAGAVYDVYNSSGTKIYSDLTTNANGTIILDGLTSGTYRIVEKTAPDGYIISETEKTVNFNVNDASSGSVTFTDERKHAYVNVYKVDSISGKALAGATFALMAGEDITVGTITIKAGTVLETAVSGSDGYVNFTTDLPLGFKYQVKETEAPENYELSDEVFEFTATAASGNSTTYTHSFTCKNDHGPNWEEPGKITVTKTDENGNPLAGAVFKLEYSANNGTTWAPVYYSVEALGGNYLVGATTSSVTNGTLTTDASGVIVFSELKADGNVMYRLTETQAPDGYTLPDDPVIFRGTLPVADATAPGGTDYEIEFTVVNEFKPGSLTVKKVSTFGIALAGATYLLEYSTDDGATWANIKAADPGQSTPKVGTTTATGLSGGTLTTTASTNPVVFSDLRADGTVKYRLTEVKAPDGYDLVTETIYEGYLPLENGDDDVFEISIVVHNSPVIKLPHTGASGFLFPALGACFGTGAGVVGILLGKRKKGKHSKD